MGVGRAGSGGSASRPHRSRGGLGRARRSDRGRRAGRPPWRRGSARSRRSASWRPYRTGSSGPRRTRGRARPGRRRPAPSGSSGRSCGCASPTGRTSTRSSRASPVIRTSRPVSSSTSRRAVCSRRLARVGRALGERPGPAVALPTAAAHDEPWLARLVADDDPAGGGGGRGPQARHGADAAPGRRTAPGRPDLAHSMVTVGRGRPLAVRFGQRPAGSPASWPADAPAARPPGRAASVERTPGAWKDPDGRRPSRRSLTRVEGRTNRAAGRAAYLAAML